MHGQFEGDYIFLRDMNDKLVVGFSNGEDAVIFKLKSLDIEYLKITDPAKAESLVSTKTIAP